ncbi:TetR/AcrR family transcriptional regulator [Aquihabitans sp. G128]|uniref:TetR/AcrR family transcriptional regulator n=1 Tax=Aquihabitans sp. G128 TaxID=2849779 RepID=UPI001C24E9DF|nr:TetR/AcrR family transcriptional regulator [Aquihabitans sp. G128]QXC60688.1 TetR/AcrR family transcriptional regulator [Aquihabitans sp. G128]
MSAKAAGNPSRQALLDSAVAMLEERGPDGFTVEEVLIESGTSSSSLYHHFGNRQGLLVAAQDERYRRLARAEDPRRLDGGYAATTPEEFLDYVAGQLRRVVTDPANVATRRKRLEVAAGSLSSPELAAQTIPVQENLFGVIAAMYEDAQRRGLVNPDLDCRAYAIWFHGVALGRTATEAGSVDAEAWLSVAIPAALAPLRLPADSA